MFEQFWKIQIYFILIMKIDEEIRLPIIYNNRKKKGRCVEMKLEVFENYEEMSRYAADVLQRQISEKPDSVLGLPTGSTPLGMYRELAKRNLDFSGITTFNLDEYYKIQKSDEQSYDYFMHHNFFDHINMKPENINIPNGEADDPQAECRRYDGAIEKAGGVDLQVLGIGNNGHIGFNEPADRLCAATNLVTLTESTISANSRFFDRIEVVPRQALTTGLKAIMNAKKIIVLVTGGSKAKILKDTFSGIVTTQNPASVLQLHSDVTFIVDRDAAALLQ